MAKPILVMAIPYDTSSIESINSQLVHLKKELNDYHVIAYRANDIHSLKLEVLNADNADELDIEKLKEEINSKITK